MQRRILRSISLATVLLFLAPPAIAAADAAGPTDYRSEVVGIDPPTPTIHPSVVGGDSFLLLRVDRGTSVEVSGYHNEPFLRFLADGTVLENTASATFALSKTRYGGALPAGFDEQATPVWRRVAGDGTYAWHDHRIHWMSNVRPPGKRPGDIVLRSPLPMTVNGVAVNVTVQSVWMAPASLLPVWLGALLGLAVGLPAGLGRATRRRWLLLVPLVALTGLATAVGWWQYGSIPASAGPRMVWVALPLVAMLATLGTVASRAVLTRAALVTVSGVNLFLWAWLRRDGFIRAVLPTNAPGWLDRFAAAASMSCGPVLAAFGVATLLLAVAAPQRLVTSAS